ncbi:MAG: oligosaccharide flippase family protein [Bacteroidetes bacterium]|nr:oligosaccharide flippase family protein [Bacteroidota bacterium]
MSFYTKLAGTFNTVKKSAIAENFFILGSIQSINLLLPLVLTPYLIHILGLINFGKITFAAAVINIFGLLIDYGFNLTGTKEIALNKHQEDALGKIVSGILTTKFFLMLFTFLLLNAGLLTPFLSENKTLFLLSFIICIGQSINPGWIFQGLEKMRLFAIVNVVFKISYMLVIFIFIKEKSDYIYVNALFGISILFTGIVSIILLHIKFNIRFSLVSPVDVFAYLKKSFYYFISGFFVNISGYAGSAILGIYTDYRIVGLYGIVEKILQLVRQLLIIYSQVLYPAACRKAQESIHAYSLFMKKVFTPFFISFFLICTCIFIFAPEIAWYFNKTDIDTLTNGIRIILLAALFTSLNIPAYQSLLAYNFSKSYTFVLITTSVLSVLINFFLASHYGLFGSIFNLLITEFMMMAGLHAILQFYHTKNALFQFNTKNEGSDTPPL